MVFSSMISSAELQVINTLSANKIPFFITMGFAVAYHSGSRKHDDLDISVCEGDLIKVSEILNKPLTLKDKLGVKFFNIEIDNIEIGTFSRFKNQNVVFNPSNEAIYKRCIQCELGCKVISLQDLIAKKLFFGRKKDIDDVRNLMTIKEQPSKNRGLLHFDTDIEIMQSAS